MEQAPGIKPAPLKINAMGKEGFVEEKVFDKNLKLKSDGNGMPVIVIPKSTQVINSAGKASPINMGGDYFEDRKDWKLPYLIYSMTIRPKWIAAT